MDSTQRVHIPKVLVFVSRAEWQLASQQDAADLELWSPDTSRTDISRIYSLTQSLSV